MSEPARRDLWTAGALFFAIVVVPSALSLVTVPVAFERAKSREFCASCHAMTPYVEGLKDTKGDLLSARHYQNRRINENQCFTCHSDYGLFGELRAKMGGLRHMAVYYTGSKKPIKLYKPFPNQHCLHCHEFAPTFAKSPTHQSLMEQLRSNEMSCISCHGPAHPSGRPKS